MHQEDRAVPAGYRRHLGAAGRSVVHDENWQARGFRVAAQRGEQLVQEGRPVSHRDHDGHVADRDGYGARVRGAHVH
jgi:hypothetical protein